MVSYIRPMISIGHSFNMELFTTLLSMLLFVGMSMLVGATLVKVIRAKGETANMPLTMTITAITALLLFARFGLSVTAIQGVFLMFVLLYASISDIHYHIVDDYIWVIVFALALLNVEKIGMTSMVVGALCVFILDLCDFGAPCLLGGVPAACRHFVVERLLHREAIRQGAVKGGADGGRDRFNRAVHQKIAHALFDEEQIFHQVLFVHFLPSLHERIEAREDLGVLGGDLLNAVLQLDVL